MKSFLLVTTLGTAASAFALCESDSIRLLPAGASLIAINDITVPANTEVLYFQNGRATVDPSQLRLGAAACELVYKLSNAERIIRRGYAFTYTGHLGNAVEALADPYSDVPDELKNQKRYITSLVFAGNNTLTCYTAAQNTPDANVTYSVSIAQLGSVFEGLLALGALPPPSDFP
jgi:hypothetical protein